MKLSGDRNQCPTCSVYFNSSRSFEKHRVGVFGQDRRCLTTTEMLGRGMAKNAAGFWVGNPMPTEVPSWAKGADPVSVSSIQC